MATMYYSSPKGDDRLAQLWEELRADPVPLQPAAARGRTVEAAIALRQDKPLSRKWRVDLAALFQRALEPEVLEPPPAPITAESAESETVPELSLEAAHEASLAMSCPFHWEPKPAWVNHPGGSTPAFLGPADPRRFTAQPKIPLRPLHKQPFYRRFYFYLSRWLSSPK